MAISHAHLRSFNAVATHGSFTRAAEALFVTQPTLSGQVKELEERYGVLLFMRHGRHIELTDLGKAVFDITKQLFRFEEEAEQLFLSARGLTTGKLLVAADSPYIVTPLLAQFERLYPGIKISIQYGNSKQLLGWLDSRYCDVAFLPDISVNDERLFSIPLEPGKLVVFVNQDHAWANRRSVTLGEVLEQRIILREQGSQTRATFEEAVAKDGGKINNLMEISGREGVREAVAAGFGVGIVAENEFQADTRLHSLIVSDAELIFTEYVFCLKANRSLQVTNAFLDMIEVSQNL